MTTVYVFPGQGSHRVGMGKDLFARYPHLLRQADAVLGYSVEELCLSGPDARLADTRFTQPALYVVNALAYLDRVRQSGIIPQLLAGHSLGEYSALFAAGTFDFVVGLELVKKRGELMSAARGGGMAAVIGLGVDQLRDLLHRHGASTIDVANLNAPAQAVISGPKADVEALKPHLERHARAVVLLNVSAAFHSRYMKAAAEEFGAFLDRYHLADPKIPVIANVTAAPYQFGCVRELLSRQISSPVRWMETVEYLLEQPACDIHEIGPGQVLTGLVNQIRQARPVAPLAASA